MIKKRNTRKNKGHSFPAPLSRSARDVGSRPLPDEGSKNLRQKAELRLLDRVEHIAELSDKETAELIHELGTHQIELEMQNEELRRLQRQLEISRHQYEDLFDFAPLGYVLLTPSYTILAANMTIAGMLNVARTTLSGRLFKDYVHKEDRDILYAHLDRLEELKTKHTCELRLTGDDPAMYVRLDSMPLTDEQGNIFELRLALTDISDQRRAEKEREQLIEKLEKAVRELHGFTYSISHDLRAPIRHISSYATLLQQEVGALLGEKGRQKMKTITDAANKLGLLVDELLEFSRIGHTTMEKSRVDLNPLIRDIVRNYAEESDRHIDWTIASLPNVPGDPAMLQLVFTNLIDNAVKYTGNRSPAMIDIGSFSEEDCCVIYVRDNGIGFDMRYYNKLFGLFQRLHTAEEFEGTGIGLANVQRIVERHGGRVWADSRIDEGATFFISLPVI